MKRWTSVAAFTFLGFAGLLSRTLVFSRQHSLTHDECAVCLNVVERPAPGLTRGLSYDQAAPLGFLLLEKAALKWLGGGDVQTRIVPFTFGILTLPVSAFFFVRVFGGSWRTWPALCAFGMVALSRSDILFGAIAKQYTEECLVTALLLWLLSYAVERSGRPSLYARLCTIGLVLAPILLWFSYGAFFVLAAIGTVLCVRAVQSPDRSARLRFAAFAVSFALFAGLFYLVSARAALTNRSLAAMWTSSYMPLWPPLASVQWQARVWQDIGVPVIHPRLWWLLPMSVLFMAVQAVRKREPVTAAALLSVVFCLAASALNRYPFSSRLLLFLLPVFGYSAGLAVKAMGRSKEYLGALLALTVLAAEASAMTHEIFLGNTSVDDVRQVHRTLAKEVQPGDSLWVSDGSQPCFRYYARQYPMQNQVAVHFLHPSELPHLHPGRNWVLVVLLTAKKGEGEDILRSCAQQGKIMESVGAEWTSASLVLVPQS